MKRAFPRSPSHALLGLAAGVVCSFGVGCSPSNNVKPGAPELIKMVVVEGVEAPAPVTTILPDTPDCPTPLAAGTDGTACDPTSDSLCRLTTDNNWCTCGGTDPQTPTAGAWSCPPLSDVVAVIWVFDRLLDTTPLDPGDAAARSDIATLSVTPGPAPPLLTDYASNGSTTGLIFTVFASFFGSNRDDGPSLLAAAQPAFPSSSTISVTLDKTKVLAKDGHTQFTSSGPIQDGAISFTTAPFAASITPPPPEMVDGGEPDGGTAPSAPDMEPATVTFTNLVDPAAILSFVTVTANGAALGSSDLTLTCDGETVTITPVTSWPASSTIAITVDAAATDLLGETLGAPVSASFVTGAAPPPSM